MTRWRIQVSGAEKDLSRLADLADDTEWRIWFDDEIGGYCLRSRAFESLANAGEIRHRAETLAISITLAASTLWPDIHDLDLGAVHETREDGGRNITVLVGAAIEIDEALAVNSVGGTQATPSIQSRMDLLSRCPEIGISLRYVREEGGWPGFYKAYEAIGKSGEIVRRGIVARKECDRFTRSADPHRHHRENIPDGLMTLAEGRAWIINVAQQLIQQLLDEQ